MKAPRSWFWRLASEFLPSIWGAALALIAVACIAGELALATLIGLLVINGKNGPMAALDLHDSLFAGLVGPIAVALLWLAAMLPSRTGFRAVLLLGTCAVLLVAGTSCAITAPHIDPKGGMLAIGMATYIPALLGTLLVTAGALLAIPLKVRTSGEDEAEAWLAEQIRAKPVHEADIAATLGRTADWIHNVSINLAADGLLDLRHTAGWLVHRDHVAAGMQRLMAASEATPHLPTASLLEECALPEALGRPWLDELVADPTVPMTVDRDADHVLWDVSIQADAMNWCARCGGPEHIAGGALVRCSGCGWEREA